MCGIIGVYLQNVSSAQLTKVKDLIQESGIRGIHAAGIAALKKGKIILDNSHGSSKNFLEEHHLEDYSDNGDLTLIAHTRYSTSDLRFNQPIGDKGLAIVHNGVISQENPRTWKKTFGLETKTTNDSELIFAALKKKKEPLQVFEGSMAVCHIDKKGGLHAFRNGERPLWYSQQKNGVVFASTKNILVRSGFKSPKKCKMFTKYYAKDEYLLVAPQEIPKGTEDWQ